MVVWSRVCHGTIKNILWWKCWSWSTQNGNQYQLSTTWEWELLKYHQIGIDKARSHNEFELGFILWIIFTLLSTSGPANMGVFQKVAIKLSVMKEPLSVLLIRKSPRKTLIWWSTVVNQLNQQWAPSIPTWILLLLDSEGQIFILFALHIMTINPMCRI